MTSGRPEREDHHHAARGSPDLPFADRRAGRRAPHRAGRTLKFEGRPYGSGISYFLVDNDPGQGPDLHRHPYPETWIVLDGEARITIGDEQVIATAGDTATVVANVWHGFKNSGTGRLRIMCIHASDVMIQEDLDA